MQRSGIRPRRGRAGPPLLAATTQHPQPTRHGRTRKRRRASFVHLCAASPSPRDPQPTGRHYVGKARKSFYLVPRISSHAVGAGHGALWPVAGAWCVGKCGEPSGVCAWRHAETIGDRPAVNWVRKRALDRDEMHLREDVQRSRTRRPCVVSASPMRRSWCGCGVCARDADGEGTVHAGVVCPACAFFHAPPC